jgi:hypothetical protein
LEGKPQKWYWVLFIDSKRNVWYSLVVIEQSHEKLSANYAFVTAIKLQNRCWNVMIIMKKAHQNSGTLTRHWVKERWKIEWWTFRQVKLGGQNLSPYRLGQLSLVCSEALWSSCGSYKITFLSSLI